MFVRDVIGFRFLVIMALGAALLVTSVRAAHCERSRGLLAAAIVTELTDDGASAQDAPPSHAPLDGNATLDSTCTSTAAVMPSRVSTHVRPGTATNASYVARALSPRRTGFSLERPPRSY
ncbi:MAG: hypothetical protein HOV81_20605 [Kofleriaceae bacterium]|nr:hypothetical protein [Kofleriaceae bacterium]